ncbi:LRR domain containing protein [Trema orientale]|uniref:LRR domain containing protein n=1 Tax=Trema orientale TaxID=63057 RepID=A0A2P5G298_TREOI|nr:LRR domain containing protein [Trema orientale]
MSSSSVPNPRRNWLELPREIVCKTWLEICKDPLVWRTIDMYNIGESGLDMNLDRLCRLAVDRSCGQLVDITIEYFDEGFIETIAKLPLLEELDLTLCPFSLEPLEAVGRCCTRLKSLKLNCEACNLPIEPDEEAEINAEVFIISKNMSDLRHLQLIGNLMTNMGLQAILDGCPHLESLDLRRCLNIDLKGDLGKRCFEQIKYLRLPNDSTKDYGFITGPEDYHCSDFGSFAEEYYYPSCSSYFDEYPEDYPGCGSFNLEGYPSCFSDFDEYPEDVDFECFGFSSGADSFDYDDSTMLDDDSEGSRTISSD